MRIVFFGSGEMGLPTLQRLVATQQLLAVVTQPDRPAGRKRQMTPTPIGLYAQEAQLPLLKCENVNDPPFIAQLAALGSSAAVVIAFGQKLSAALLERMAPLAINLHASLLPELRGAAPVNWAILRGLAQTGQSVIALAQKMDAGVIYAQRATPIHPAETAGELHDRLAAMGPDLIEEVLARQQAGTLQGQPQDESRATRAPKLSKADGWVDFSASSEAVRRRIHGLTPWPGITVRWLSARGFRELILRRVAAEAETALHDLVVRPQPGTVLTGGLVVAGQGAIRLLEVQLPGKRALPLEEFERGHPLALGDQLHSSPPGSAGQGPPAL